MKEKSLKERELDISDIKGARSTIEDLKVFGNGDMFQLLCKASSESRGFMKSIKAMEIDGIGCVIQVTTQQKNLDESYSVAEAVCFVPGVKVTEDDNYGRKLVPFC